MRSPKDVTAHVSGGMSGEHPVEHIGNSKERRAFMTFKVYDVTGYDISTRLSIMNVLLRLLGLSVRLRGYYYNSLL